MLLDLLQLLLQPRLGLLGLRQFSFQFTPTLANLVGLLLGPFPPPGLLGQRLGQGGDLLLDFRLGCLQFPGTRFQPGMLGKVILFLCLQLLLSLLQLLPQ